MEDETLVEAVIRRRNFVLTYRFFKIMTKKVRAEQEIAEELNREGE